MVPIVIDIRGVPRLSTEVLRFALWPNPK